MHWWPFNFYLYFSFMVTCVLRTITRYFCFCSIPIYSNILYIQTVSGQAENCESTMFSILVSVFPIALRLDQYHNNRNEEQENYNNFSLIMFLTYFASNFYSIYSHFYFVVRIVFFLFCSWCHLQRKFDGHLCCCCCWLVDSLSFSWIRAETRKKPRLKRRK